MHYKWCKENHKDTKSLIRGRLVHTLILEPNTFNSVYAVEPDKKDYKFVTIEDLKPLCEKYGTKKSGKKEDILKELSPFLTKDERSQVYDLVYSAFLFECEGKEIVSAKDFQEARAISESVLNSPKIQKMLKLGEAELSIFLEINGVQMKTRLDFMSSDFFLDIKTCSSCDEREFVRDFINYQYDIKLAVYQKAIELETGKKIPCIVLAVETSDEHDYKVYNIDQEFLDIGYKKFEAMLETWKDCTSKNEWLGMSKEVETLFAPEWYLKNHL